MQEEKKKEVKLDAKSQAIFERLRGEIISRLEEMSLITERSILINYPEFEDKIKNKSEKVSIQFSYDSSEKMPPEDNGMYKQCFCCGDNCCLVCHPGAAACYIIGYYE